MAKNNGTPNITILDVYPVDSIDLKSGQPITEYKIKFKVETIERPRTVRVCWSFNYTLIKQAIIKEALKALDERATALAIKTQLKKEFEV